MNNNSHFHVYMQYDIRRMLANDLESKKRYDI